jgi:hypothetical protein
MLKIKIIHSAERLAIKWSRKFLPESVRHRKLRSLSADAEMVEQLIAPGTTFEEGATTGRAIPF